MIAGSPTRTRIIVLSQAAADGEFPIAQRLLTLKEAAKVIGVNHLTLEDLVSSRKLPIVRMPSRSDEPTRTPRRVPACWLDHWMEMSDRSIVRRVTRDEIGPHDGEPLEVSVHVSATAVGISRYTAYELIKAGRFARTKQGYEGTLRVRVDDLDDWVFGLIREAEEAWYGVHLREAVNA